ATNAAGLTAAADFTVTPDTSAPSGQSVALSGGPWYAPAGVALMLGNGSDDASGVDAGSGVVERDSAPLADGVCGGFSGSWTQVALVGGADTTVVSGDCYRYRYTVSDNVGNTAPASASSADAKVSDRAPVVDVTAPTE